MGFKVVYTDTIFPDLSVEEEVLKELEDSELVFVNDRSEESIMKASADCDALVVVYAKITERIINSLQKCKIIVRTGIGVDNIDVEAATKKGIMVANVPDYCWDEVSDHTIASALTLVRKVVMFDKKVKSGDWSHEGVKPIFGMKGQTYGLIGFGSIAKMVAKKAQVFGFEVIAYDPYVKQEDADKYNVKIVPLEELLKSSDIISVHAPLTKETHHLINEKTLNLMKSTAYLINTARGGLVDTKALYSALKEKRIAGAALDVLETEPPESNDPIFSLDNIIITPHAAFYSEASTINLRRYAFAEVVRVLKGDNPKNLVNKNVINK